MIGVARLTLLVVVSGVFHEAITAPSWLDASHGHFLLGVFQVAKESDLIPTLRSCLGRHINLDLVLLRVHAARGLSLLEYSRFAINNQFYKQLSDELNHCSRGKQMNETEILHHASLALWPWNTLSIKNLGHHLEVNSFNKEVAALYSTGIKTVSDAGLLIQDAFRCPHLFSSHEEALASHLNILVKIYDVLITVQTTNIKGYNPMGEIRDIQQGTQYTGFNPGLIFEGYSRCWLALFPPLATENLRFLPDVRERKSTLRVGIVSEQYGNSSPGLCLQDILPHLPGIYRDVDIELIFFTRPGLNTVFAEAASRASVLTFELDEFDIDYSTALIRDIARPDILLFMALPTEVFTLALAHYRLAPIQIQYGLGHPFSSGVRNSIDYSVISRLMLADDSDLRMPSERLGALESTDLLITCANAAAICRKSLHYPLNSRLSEVDALSCRQSIPAMCWASGQSSLHYTEQVILFESPGFQIKDFSLLYFSSLEDVLQLSLGRQCDDVDALFRSLSLSISAADLGCSDEALGVSRYHLYNCIQHIKKMHPDLDRALFGIIRTDEKAKILLSSGSQELLTRRWRQSPLNVTEQEIRDRMVFVPRLEHDVYLRLLSFSSVFLNPFPFGSGITSSDAISVCIPLVLCPKEISVLQFALAQVRILGEEYESVFVADSVDMYVSRAVLLARMPAEERLSLRRRMCIDKNRLFGRQALMDTALEWKQLLRNLLKNVLNSE